MFRKEKRKPMSFGLRPVSDTAGTILLRGQLPDCAGNALPARYYRHLEQLIRRRMEALPGPGELRLDTVLCSPDDFLCSVRIKAELTYHGRRIPIFTDGCVWDTRNGRLLSFRALTGCHFSVKKLLPLLLPRKEPEWLLRTCPDWENRIKSNLSRYRFCLESDALVLYLPPLTLDEPLENLCRLPFPLKYR